VSGRRLPARGEELEHRLDPRNQGRFNSPTETQARDGDAELRGGDDMANLADLLLQRLGPAMPLTNQLFDLRPAYRDQRELRRHEETIEKQQNRNGRDSQRIPVPVLDRPQRWARAHGALRLTRISPVRIGSSP